MLVILAFGYQQSVIIRKINELSEQRINDGSLFFTGSGNDVPSAIRLFRMSGRPLGSAKKPVSKQDIDELIRSLNSLQIKYRDIMDQIKDDPEMKDYIETRMKEISHQKN